MNLNCCCESYEESSLKENLTFKSNLTKSNAINKPSDLKQIKFINLIEFIVNIYRILLFYLTKAFNSIIYFRTDLFDAIKSTSCSENHKIDDKINRRQSYNCKITDIPEYLRFNPFILEGYRSTLDFKESLLSFFYIHNETTNIYSHAFAFFYFLFFMPRRLPWSIISSNYLCLFFAISHVFSSIAPWLGSTIYHLFMNHKNGQKIYNKLLAFDVMGIWCTQTFGALLPVYMSVVAFNRTFRYFYLTLYILLAIRSLYDVLIIGGRLRRRFGFSYLVFMRFLSIYLRTYSNKAVNYDDLILQELYPIIGALISAYRIPEIFSPGTFDLFMNSHNLMHFLVVLATFHLHSSAFYDLILLSKY